MISNQPAPAKLFTPMTNRRAGRPTEGTAIAVRGAARTGRGRRADGFGDRAVHRHRHVVLGIGAAQPVAASSSPGHFGSGGQGSNARSGPAAGGSSGTVGNVAKSNFTLTTSAGQEVTVDESSSTKYDKGTSPTSKSAVAKGDHVLVLGTVSSTTIKATQVTVQTSGAGSKPSTAAAVVPFQKGAAGTSKQVGQIPASYSQGSGTIVSGTTANKATEAALAAYPGESSTVW